MSPRCRGVLLVMWLGLSPSLPYMLAAKFGRASGGRLGLGGLGLGLRIGLGIVLGLGLGLVLGLGLWCGPVALVPMGVTGLSYRLSPSCTPPWGTGCVGPRNDPVSSQPGPHIHVLSKLGMASAMANFTLGDVFHVRKSASVRRRATSPTSFAS